LQPANVVPSKKHWLSGLAGYAGESSGIIAKPAAPSGSQLHNFQIRRDVVLY
jgi:hypothetical protein